VDGLFLVLTAVTFSLVGFIIGIWADGFEKLQVVPLLIITPLTFLGGSFYSIDMLPPAWQTVALFNPVVYLISGFRWSFYGIADVGLGVSLGMTMAFLVCRSRPWRGSSGRDTAEGLTIVVRGRTRCCGCAAQDEAGRLRRSRSQACSVRCQRAHRPGGRRDEPVEQRLLLCAQRHGKVGTTVTTVVSACAATLGGKPWPRSRYTWWPRRSRICWTPVIVGTSTHRPAIQAKPSTGISQRRIASLSR